MKPLIRNSFLFLFIFPIIAFAQKDPLIKSNFCIKISPFALVDPWRGTCSKLGAEFNISKSISTYIEYGQYFPKFNIPNIDQDHKGFMCELQLKYYGDRKEGLYLALVLSFTTQSYHRKDSIELHSNTFPVVYTKYTKEYDLSKDVSSIGFNAGQLYMLNKIVLIDWWFGTGLRMGNTSCSLTDEEADHRILGDWTNPTRPLNRCGHYVIPYFSFGIKFGFIIK